MAGKFDRRYKTKINNLGPTRSGRGAGVGDVVPPVYRSAGRCGFGADLRGPRGAQGFPRKRAHLPQLALHVGHARIYRVGAHPCHALRLNVTGRAGLLVGRRARACNGCCPPLADPLVRAMRIPSSRAGAHGFREEERRGCGGRLARERLAVGHRHRLLLLCR